MSIKSFINKFLKIGRLKYRYYDELKKPDRTKAEKIFMKRDNWGDKRLGEEGWYFW
jgi:hypothetical protein